MSESHDLPQITPKTAIQDIHTAHAEEIARESNNLPASFVDKLAKTMTIRDYYEFKSRALQKSLQETENLVLIDELTGLPNFRALQSDLKTLIGQNNRVGAEGQQPKSIKVAIFDFDKFKNLNEAYGHLTANEILKLMKILSYESRPGEKIYRLGGDEFVKIMEDVDDSKLEAMTDRMNMRMGEMSAIMLEKARINNDKIEAPKAARMSFGVAEYQKGENITDFLARADIALNQVKQTGRGKVMFATLNSKQEIEVRELQNKQQAKAA